MEDDIFEDAERRMQKAVEALRHDVAAIRTGRANSALLERISVDYYGTPTPINQVATITVPEARMLIIQPWDRKMLADIRAGDNLFGLSYFDANSSDKDTPPAGHIGATIPDWARTRTRTGAKERRTRRPDSGCCPRRRPRMPSRATGRLPSSASRGGRASRSGTRPRRFRSG